MAIREIFSTILKKTIGKEGDKTFFFYFDTKQIQDVTGLSERAVSRSLNKLVEAEMITKLQYRSPFQNGKFTKYRVANKDVMKLLDVIKDEEE